MAVVDGDGVILDDGDGGFLWADGDGALVKTDDSCAECCPTSPTLDITLSWTGGATYFMWLDQVFTNGQTISLAAPPASYNYNPASTHTPTSLQTSSAAGGETFAKNGVYWPTTDTRNPCTYALGCGGNFRAQWAPVTYSVLRVFFSSGAGAKLLGFEVNPGDVTLTSGLGTYSIGGFAPRAGRVPNGAFGSATVNWGTVCSSSWGTVTYQWARGGSWGTT